MSLKHDFCHNRKLKLIAYEEMIDEKSYIFIRCAGEEMRMPIEAWRELNKAWNEKGWGEEFDDLDKVVPRLVEN